MISIAMTDNIMNLWQSFISLVIAITIKVLLIKMIKEQKIMIVKKRK